MAEKANLKSWILISVFLFGMGFVAGSPVLAFVEFKDGLIHNIDYDLGGYVQIDYQAPGMGTTLNLLGGGNIEYWLRGWEDSHINILGGSIGYDLSGRDRSEIDMSGGSIGCSMWIYGRTQVSISGGSIGYGIWAADSSEVEISGGSIGERLGGYGGSEGEIRPLTVVFGLEAYDSSHVDISGGSINDKLALDDSAVIRIYGGDFEVDEEAFGYGELTSIKGGYWRSEPRRHLTGRLASGEPIDNDFYIGNEARIVLIQHPIHPPILLYVDDDAENDPGPGDPAIGDPCENGTMEHPYDAIQEAIDIAGYGDTVIVFDGTYTGDGNRDIDFLGKAITVRSENGPDNCIIDCQATYYEPHRGFYFHCNEDESSLLQGFTITNGNVEGLYRDDQGGGIYCVIASPTIAGNIIRHNNAEIGGGICCKSCLRSLRIVGNTISANEADDVGAIYCVESRPMIINNIITNNIGWTEKGGLLFSGCPSGMIVNNVIAGNLGEDGAGGGIMLNHSSLTVASCTIAGNEGHYGGQSGIWLMDSSSAVVINSIVWGNYKDQITCYRNSYAEVRYSNVEGGYEGVGNIDVDPCFVNPCYLEWRPLQWVDGDYHLLPNSWCIDAGDNYALPSDTTDLDGDGNTTESLPFDLDGYPRILDGDNDGFAVVDMGAYEYWFTISAKARIVPRTINLASKGKWITCYIWLPEDFNVADIDPNSVFLEEQIKAEQFWIDEEESVAVARFCREEVQTILSPGEIELTITGRLTDGTVFEGSDVIRVLNRVDGESAKWKK